MQSSAELVQAILEDGYVAPEIRDLIFTRAAGNPLFMEELTQSLLENGSIEKSGTRGACCSGSHLIHETESGRLSPQVSGRLAYISNILLRAVEGSELERRMEVLEKSMGGRP